MAEIRGKREGDTKALAVLFKLPHQTDSRFSSQAKENVSICLNHFGC